MLGGVQGGGGGCPGGVCVCVSGGVQHPADPARRPLRSSALPGKGCLERGRWAEAAPGAPARGRSGCGRRQEEAGLSGLCAARRVARRLGWHGHQLAVPLPQRARGGGGRRLLQSAPLPVPVRARQGEAGPGPRAGGGPRGLALPATPPPAPPRPQAPSLVYGGHGSHVTSVRFTHDDSHLISLGGKDASIFQWRVLGAGGSGPAPATPSRTPSLSPASSLDV